MTTIPLAISRPTTEFGVQLPDPKTGKPVFISYEWLSELVNTESGGPRAQFSRCEGMDALVAAGWAQRWGANIEATNTYLSDIWPALDIELFPLFETNRIARATTETTTSEVWEVWRHDQKDKFPDNLAPGGWNPAKHEAHARDVAAMWKGGKVRKVTVHRTIEEDPQETSTAARCHSPHVLMVCGRKVARRTGPPVRGQMAASRPIRDGCATEATRVSRFDVSRGRRGVMPQMPVGCLGLLSSRPSAHGQRTPGSRPCSAFGCRSHGPGSAPTHPDAAHAACMENEARDHWVERRHQPLTEHGHPTDRTLIERYDSIALGAASYARSQNLTGHFKDAKLIKEWIFASMKPRADGSRQLNFYRKNYKPKATGRSSFTSDVTAAHKVELTDYPELLPAIISLVQRVSGPIDPRVLDLPPQEQVFALSYPYLAATADWDNNTLSGTPVYGLAKALRTTTARDFAVAAFGKKTVRKDLVKAVASAPMSRITTAVHLKREVPVDWLVSMLNAEATPDEMKTAPVWERHYTGQQPKHILALVPEHARRRLILAPELRAIRGRLIPDIQNMMHILSADGVPAADWTTPEIAAARNWTALHDAITTVYRARQEAAHVLRYGPREIVPEVPIEQSGLYEQLDGITALDGKLRMVSVKHERELHDWGSAMRNCIGSYARRAQRHQCFLFAVCDGDKMISNVEISPEGAVRQMVGRYNATLPDDVRLPMLTAIERALELAHV